MSTDGNLPDLKFPQTGGQGNSIHLSANTLKQHGRNGNMSDFPLVCISLDFYCATSARGQFTGLNEQSIAEIVRVCNTLIMTSYCFFAFQ